MTAAASFHRRISALAEAVLPPPPGGAAVPGPGLVAQRLAVFVEGMPAAHRLGIRAACAILSWSPLFLSRHLRPLGRLTVEARRAHLSRLQHSRLRALRDLSQSLAALVLAVYYDDPSVGASLGYHLDEHIAAVNAPRDRERRP